MTGRVVYDCAQKRGIFWLKVSCESAYMKTNPERLQSSPHSCVKGRIKWYNLQSGWNRGNNSSRPFSMKRKRAFLFAENERRMGVMIKVTLKDGVVKEFDASVSVLEIAESISAGLARNACVGIVDGEAQDLRYVVDKDSKVEICTFDDEEGTSHIMAQAVKRLFPETKLAIGPSIADGFYYDFDRETPFTEDDLTHIEEEMKKIVKEDLKLERFELPRADAIKLMEEKGEPYKVELINDLPEDSIISFYKQGEYTDLCAGPHLMSTKPVKAFKLMSVAGAYWRGNEKNKMLSRIYGTAYPKASELEAYLNLLEEAKKRDHRKLGKELKLFALLEEGPGFPFFLPKGMVLKNTLMEYWREIHRKAGYVEISTPIILSRKLWENSGHWDHYKDNMYTTVIDDEDYAVKPMNCPGGMLVYKQDLHSYRDLPMRVAEIGLVHRHEKSGALHGLMRVRCFNQDDAHIFMTEEQIPEEISGVISLIDQVYKLFGFKYHIELSTRPEDSMGSDEAWETATNGLISALKANNIDYVVNEGDGAFYGPKIDFHLEDSLGRTWQCGTIQLDMQMPERFDLTYTDKDGVKKRPVMIHRVCFGSIERFIGILIEHYAGAFPTWLSPVQAKVLTISEKSDSYAEGVAKKLEEAGIRVETDLRAEKIGFKIREARSERVPYILVVGEKDAEANMVSLRTREGEEGQKALDEVIERMKKEIKDRV